MQYIPLYEYNLIKYCNKQIKDKTKDNLLTFYCGAKSKKRAYLLDKEFNKEYDIKICVKERVDTISQSEYYDKLAKSKFTIVIPPYDKESFSVIRFIEAIANDCLPLVEENCNLQDL